MWLLWFPMFGTWWWVISILFFISLVSLVEHEISEGAFAVLVAYTFVLLFLGDISWLFTWIGDHPFKTGTSLFAYFALGVPWAAFWWWWKQSEKRDQYNDAKRHFVQIYDLCEAGQDPLTVKIPDELLIKWKDYYVSGEVSHPRGLRAFWKQHSRSLTCAMTWWPLHMGSFFFKDFLWNFWKRVLNAFQFLFDRIDNKIWGDVDDDFREIPREILDAHRREDYGSRMPRA